MGAQYTLMESSRHCRRHGSFARRQLSRNNRLFRTSQESVSSRSRCKRTCILPLKSGRILINNLFLVNFAILVKLSVSKNLAASCYSDLVNYCSLGQFLNFLKLRINLWNTVFNSLVNYVGGWCMLRIVYLCNAVVTCEIKLFWNDFVNISVFYFTCNQVWNWNKIMSASEKVMRSFQNYFSDIEHVGKYSWAEIICVSPADMMRLLPILDLRRRTFLYWKCN